MIALHSHAVELKCEEHRASHSCIFKDTNTKELAIKKNVYFTYERETQKERKLDMSGEEEEEEEEEAEAEAFIHAMGAYPLTVVHTLNFPTCC